VKSTVSLIYKPRLNRRSHGSIFSGSKKQFFDYPEPNPGIIGTIFQRGDHTAHKLTLKQACQGFIHYKIAVGLSPHTIADYKITFERLFLFIKEYTLFEDIKRKNIIEFFALLEEDYILNPDGIAPRKKKPLAPKTIRNIYTNLSALCSWAAEEGFVKKSVVKDIYKPPASPPVIEPFTKEAVATLLKACETTSNWRTRSSVSNTRPTADRDKAFILTLLDTSVRASELCGMRYGDVNLTTNSIRVRDKGAGKDSKPRIVYFGKNIGKAIWKNLLPRLDDDI
jgi:integrase/recombinase XerD